MLQFKIDWEDEPRIRDPLLRATWARLEIRVGSAAQDLCLTDCIGAKSQSLRQGVYGSVFPLAEWIVENWWALLYESPRTEQFHGVRLLEKNNPSLKRWAQRHGILTARSGFALPDLSFYHDGNRIAAKCVADPFDDQSPYPVRFVRDAEIRLGLAETEKGLAGFVNAVIERASEHAPDEVESRELRENWTAVHDSSQCEPEICRVAAAMGLDPYDPDELTDQLLEVIEGPFRSLALSLRWDLAESTTGKQFANDLDWVRAAAQNSASQESSKGISSQPDESGAVYAHQAGYERAREFVKKFGAPSVDGLEEFVKVQCGWSEPIWTEEARLRFDGVAARISAFVGPDDSGRTRLVAAGPHSRSMSRRFLLGRALFFAPSAECQAPPRLLTRASAWSQRVSRAFAAELLVPADALRERVADQITFERISELAREFDVSEMVIKHQLENHNIAQIVDL